MIDIFEIAINIESNSNLKDFNKFIKFLEVHSNSKVKSLPLLEYGARYIYWRNNEFIVSRKPGHHKVIYTWEKVLEHHLNIVILKNTELTPKNHKPKPKSVFHILEHHNIKNKKQTEIMDIIKDLFIAYDKRIEDLQNEVKKLKEQNKIVDKQYL